MVKFFIQHLWMFHDAVADQVCTTMLHPVMRISSIFISQHVGYRVVKRVQFVAATMLRDIVLKCCDRLVGACKCWAANNAGIRCVDVLRSFGRGVMYCRNIFSIEHTASDAFVAFWLVFSIVYIITQVILVF